MSLVVKKGNLFDCPGHLAHGVNCAGAMGAGIAVKFRQLYPEMFQEYRKSCLEGKIIPGSVFPWWEEEAYKINLNSRLEPDGRFIYNLAIKSHWRLPASYKALESSINNMLQHMKENNVKAVSMPWIGCGLGGLNKKDVKDIIRHQLTLIDHQKFGISITIFDNDFYTR